MLDKDGENGAAETIGNALGVPVLSAAPCAGGDINRAWRLELGDGRSAFFKSRPGAPPGEFHDEAAGLAWLAEPDGLSVPEVLAVLDPVDEASPDASNDVSCGLVLQWVEPSGPLTDEGQEAFGRGLAMVHGAGAEHHGVLAPDTVGDGIRFGTATIPAPQSAHAGFAAVYAERIEALAARSLEAAAIDCEGVAVLASLAAGIDRFAGPAELPARLHGDLWSGNVMAGPAGEPWLIDPVAQGGHCELDLAMLELFGSPGPRFYGAYEEVHPLQPGYRERIALWQIQPLLVHAILFGGGYGASAIAAARRYTG